MIRITTNVDTVILQLKQYRQNLNAKIRTFIERLGNLGVNTAEIKYRTAKYDGENDVLVLAEWESDTSLRIVASGEAVLFIEFGSGLGGYGHPQAKEFGYGPGTYSDNEAIGGKGHWTDPDGWYYRHGEKSHGNPPARAMYDAGKEMRSQIVQIAREVFAND